MALSSVHAPVLRLQCWSTVQSASAQQVPASMQVLVFAEHVADWHSVEAFDALQPVWPEAWPQSPFVPQAFAMQPLATVHATPFTPPHVFVEALQRPLSHDAFRSPAAQLS